MRFLSLSAKSRLGLMARGALLVLAAAHLTCNQAILTAPTDSTLTLIANPEFIPANGGVSVITAVVIEANTNTPVADGTVVQFFTNLGRIQEQGKTNDGVARVNLVSDSRSGRATVTAFSGAATGTEDVFIGGGVPPSQIVLTANPTRLTTQRASQITATVVDNFGNPVPNIAVIFSITRTVFVNPLPTPTPPATPTPVPSPVTEEFVESRGSPVFTDNNGRAVDVLRTNRSPGGPQVEVTVQAQVLVNNVNSEEIDIIIN